MRAVWQLWLQPWRRVIVLMLLGQLLWLGALAMLLLGDDRQGMAMAAAGLLLPGSFFVHIAQGQTLRGLCRPETFLLPSFRRRLTATATIETIQWVLLPTLLAWLIHLPHLLLFATALFGVAALGLSIGCGRRVGLLIWVVAIAAGWMPGLAAQVLQIALDSALTAPLLWLLLGWLLLITLRPLLRISDREVDVSPLESMSLGRLNAPSSGATPPRGALGKRVAGWFDITSQQALENALARYRRQPGPLRQLALVRSLLLPHDNPLAVALRLVLVALMVTLYFFVIQHRQHFNAAVIGAYAILLSISRFPQLGRGMLRMRPNLADLYLTLAPRTYVEYQKTIADALLWLVPVSVMTALAYTLLGVALVHAEEPGQMLLASLIVATAASLVALAVHLIGPEGSFGRGVVNVVVVLGAMATYWGAFWIIGALGYGFGGGVAALITLSFGLAVWFAAQREYQRRLPCFDAPLG
ncbi:MAG: hypothetical protein ABI870_11980 [Rhodanobacter sp.]